MEYVILIFLFTLSLGILLWFWYKNRNRYNEAGTVIWTFAGFLLTFSLFSWSAQFNMLPGFLVLFLHFTLIPFMYIGITTLIFRLWKPRSINTENTKADS